jgi:ribose transport system substrate-binding protein
VRQLLKSFALAGLGGAMALTAVTTGAKELTLAFVAAGLNHPFEVSVAKAFKEAGKAAGVKTIVLDSKTDIQRQSNNVDDLIAQSVDGIAAIPLDGVVAQGWVDRTSTHNIPFVAVATQVGNAEKRPLRDVYPKLAAFVTADDVKTGENAGKIAASLLPKNRVASVAIVEGAPGYAVVWQRTKGFKQGLDESGIKYRVVASQPTDWTPEKGESVCQNILTAHPNVDVIYNQADDMVIGCAKAVHSIGAHALLVGWGGSRLGLGAVKSGDVNGTVCVSPEKTGRLAFQALYEAVTKPNTPKARFIEVDTPGVTTANLSTCPSQW